MKHASSARPTALCLAASAALVLGGCQGSQSPEAAPSNRAAAIAPDAKPGVTLDAARVVLPAVSGRPGALYFTVRNTGSTPVTIAAIHVDGVGRTEAHETRGGSMKPLGDVTVPAGESLAFMPGGRHVMLFDVSPSLTAGGKSEMTLTFAGGDKVSATVAIDAPGGHEEMHGMKM